MPTLHQPVSALDVQAQAAAQGDQLSNLFTPRVMDDMMAAWNPFRRERNNPFDEL
jgi:hypothetical protein